MKKAVSVILTVVMLLSMLSLCASAAGKGNVSLILASDIHYTPAPSSLPTVNSSELYFYATAKGNLYPESAAIFDAFLAQAAASDASCVLLPGDIVDVPSAATHAYITEKLAAFEAQTGKSVYVIDGNHDVSASCSKDAFRAAYADFGYDKAVATDSASLSYVATLSDNYLLLAIDSVVIGASAGAVSAETLSWAAEQYRNAVAGGKGVIIMMHHPILEHMPLQKSFLSNYVLSDGNNIAKTFASVGMSFVFTGHDHITDTAAYTETDNAVYDINTGSLTTDNCPYRTIKISDTGITTAVKSITSIDISAISGLYTEAQRQAISASFPAYAKAFYKTGVISLLGNYLNTSLLAGKLGVQSGSAAYNVIDRIVSCTKDFGAYPMSQLRDMADSKGISIPANGYASFNDCLAEFMENITAGDENINSGTTLYKTMYNSVLAILTYAFDGIEDAELSAAVNELTPVITNRLNGIIPADQLSGVISELASGNKSRVASGLAYLVFAFVVSDLGVDDRPADNSNSFVNPFISAEMGKAQSALEKLIAFFHRILDFIVGLFTRK